MCIYSPLCRLDKNTSPLASCVKASPLRHATPIHRKQGSKDTAIARRTLTSSSTPQAIFALNTVTVFQLFFLCKCKRMSAATKSEALHDKHIVITSNEDQHSKLSHGIHTNKSAITR